jgi:predicted Zn-dependent peptidase
MKPLQEAQVLLGFEGPSLTDPDFHAAHLFSSVLGGGMASRLFQEVRESRGLCYSIYSFYWPYADTGVMGVQAATSEEDLKELVPVVLDEIVRMTDSVTEAELNRAKAQTRAGLLMALESPLARAGQMARHVLIYGRPLKLEEIVQDIEAVTIADIARLSRRMLATPPTVAAIGPIGGLPDDAAITERISGSALRLN